MQRGAEPVAGQPYKVRVDPDAVGCLGFSWGAVICSQVAVESYAQFYGLGLYEKPYQFAAHAANYPVCWGRNISVPVNPAIDIDPETNPLVPVPGALFGRNAAAPDPIMMTNATGELTGAPLLIQVGEFDYYDNDSDSEIPLLQSGSLSCLALRDNLDPDEQELVTVRVLEGAQHGFDRVYSLPFTGRDPFGQLGTEFFNVFEDPPRLPPEVKLVPDLRIAKDARRRIKRFFYRHLH